MDKKQLTYQEVDDALSAACSAATSAERRFRSLFDTISKRSIKEFRKHDTPEMVASGLAPFDASPDELEALRNSYAEWQAFKVIWKEKEEERKFWDENSRAITWEDKSKRNLRELKSELTTSIVKLVFYPVVFLAAVVYLVKTF